MAILIDGKQASREIRDALRAEAARLKAATGIVPGLAVILVGENPASRIYVGSKEKACEEAGFLSRVYRVPAETAERDILKRIRMLNDDRKIHGILVQLPLPAHIRAEAVIEAIDPRKDVDGFHPYNTGRLFSGNPLHRPCTPLGILTLLDRYGIVMEGKDAVIVGRSNIVGKPMALMLLKEDATVTVCHSKTKNLSEITKSADILICAVGRAKFVTADMVKEGAVIIDVGINRDENGKLCGDVDFEAVAEKASRITPVPGGVGPMTIAMLIENVVSAAQKK